MSTFSDENEEKPFFEKLANVVFGEGFHLKSRDLIIAATLIVLVLLINTITVLVMNDKESYENGPAIIENDTRVVPQQQADQATQPSAKAPALESAARPAAALGAGKVAKPVVEPEETPERFTAPAAPTGDDIDPAKLSVNRSGGAPSRRVDEGEMLEILGKKAN